MPTNASREIKVDNSSCFKTTFGTLNKQNPNVIYLKGRAKIRPVEERRSYASYVRSLKELVGKFVDNKFKNDDTFRNSFIFSCDLSESNLSVQKISNIRYELYLRPFEIKPVWEYKDHLTGISNEIEDVLLTITNGGLFVVS